MRLRIVLAVGIVIALALCVYKFRPSDRRIHRKVAPAAEKSVSPKADDGSRFLRMMGNVPEGALKDMFVVISGNDLPAFLENARKDGVDVRKSVGELGIALVRVQDSSSAKRLAGAIPSGSKLEYDYATFLPDKADVGAISKAEPLGASPGAAMGCPDDAGWGKGVSLALLDMKVLPHPALSSTSVVLFNDADFQNADGWHATSMASIVCGREEGLSGIARGTKLMNFVVATGEGGGDSFSIAKGIADAVRAGASLICVQSATVADSNAVEIAVGYAWDKGILIVAPSGCSGKKLYPASIDNVLGVGAVDGAGNILGSETILSDIYAPGAGLTAAVKGGEISGVGGSGVAAMVVAGALSGLIFENPGLGALAAENLVLEYADRSGLYAESEDLRVLNVDRVRGRSVPGYIDMAITGVDARPNPAGGENVRVAVRNCGTATTSFTLEVTVGAKTYKFSGQGLEANKFQVFSFDVPAGGEGEISAVVNTLGQDRNPDNNAW